jgi:hypothetical protein
MTEPIHPDDEPLEEFEPLPFEDESRDHEDADDEA